MNSTIPDGYRADSKGNLIPVKNIREVDLMRDSLVQCLIEQAKAHAGALSAFREDAMNAIADFVADSAKALKTKLGGKKGNVTLMSFDGQYKVICASSDFIAFDERLDIARTLINKCLQKWSNGADNNLIAVVNKAFQVDSDGNVSAKRILELKTLAIDDSNWKKAMEAISQATQVVASKRYVRFYERDESGQYRQISLNIAQE